MKAEKTGGRNQTIALAAWGCRALSRICFKSILRHSGSVVNHTHETSGLFGNTRESSKAVQHPQIVNQLGRAHSGTPWWSLDQSMGQGSVPLPGPTKPSAPDSVSRSPHPSFEPQIRQHTHVHARTHTLKIPFKTFAEFLLSSPVIK